MVASTCSTCLHPLSWVRLTVHITSHLALPIIAIQVRLCSFHAALALQSTFALSSIEFGAQSSQHSSLAVVVIELQLKVTIAALSRTDCIPQGHTMDATIVSMLRQKHTIFMQAAHLTMRLRPCFVLVFFCLPTTRQAAPVQGQRAVARVCVTIAANVADARSSGQEARVLANRQARDCRSPCDVPRLGSCQSRSR